MKQGYSANLSSCNKSLYELAWDNMAEGIVIVDGSGSVVAYNAVFENIWSLLDVDILHAPRDRFFTYLNRCVVKARDFKEMQTSDELETVDGRFIHCHKVARDDVGEIWYFRDVSEDHEQQAIVEKHLTEDTLTGLPNRSAFYTELNHQLTMRECRGCNTDNDQFSVVFIDLDGFKSINDSLGHKIGDLYLREVGCRINAVIEESDFLAHINGDKFVACISSVKGAHELSLMLERILSSMNRVYLLENQEIYKSASIGVACYPAHGAEPEMLMRNAEIAMYKAKDKGRNGFHFYADDLEQCAKHRLVLETKLRAAVRDNVFNLYYQPTIGMQDENLLGFEALLRWSDDELGFIGPDVFIPIAESTGLILPIGEWVIREACKQVKAWCDEGHNDIYVAVNLSAIQLQHDQLYDFIVSCVDSYGIQPRNLAIEITESMVMDNMNGAIDLLQRLRAFGILVCMDDFGTGYSSLNYLKSLPIDVLKIDRSFIQDVTENAADSAVVSSIITLGHNLGLTVVAEGVETEAHVDFLKHIDCDIVQGYFFSKPLPAVEAIKPYR